MGIIPDALVFPGVTASHHIELFVLFSEPDRRRYSGTALAEGGQADVFLAFESLEGWPWETLYGSRIDRRSGTKKSMCGLLCFSQCQEARIFPHLTYSTRRPQWESALSGLVRL